MIKRQIIFIIIFCAVIVINIPFLLKEVEKIHALRAGRANQVIGYKFKGLDQFLKGEKYVGYYTGEDISRRDHHKLYSQAQYIVTPSILEYNSLKHKYTIFACSIEDVCIRKINQLKAKPLRRNSYGIILAQTQP